MWLQRPRECVHVDFQMTICFAFLARTSLESCLKKTGLPLTWCFPDIHWYAQVLQHPSSNFTNQLLCLWVLIKFSKTHNVCETSVCWWSVSRQPSIPLEARETESVIANKSNRPARKIKRRKWIEVMLLTCRGTVQTDGAWRNCITIVTWTKSFGDITRAMPQRDWFRDSGFGDWGGIQPLHVLTWLLRIDKLEIDYGFREMFILGPL